MANVVYKETQPFRRNLLWLLCLIAPAIILALLIIQRLQGYPIFDNNLPDIPLILVSGLYIIPAIICLYTIKLSVIIDEEKISFGWNIPTSDLNEIKLRDISAYSVIEYRFVGYGFRISNLHGTVYNVSGNKGLQIITNSGEKILIGSRDPEELKKQIEKIQTNKTDSPDLLTLTQKK